jgi:hypothetical protein
LTPPGYLVVSANQNFKAVQSAAFDLLLPVFLEKHREQAGRGRKWHGGGWLP